MNINDQKQSGGQHTPHPVRNPRDAVRKQNTETAGTAEQEIRRNHEALMKFFADAEKQASDKAGADGTADTEPLFVPALFTPELSEPLSILGDGEEQEPLAEPTPTAVPVSHAAAEAPRQTAAASSDTTSELRAMVTAAIAEEASPTTPDTEPAPGSRDDSIAAVDDTGTPKRMIQTDPPEEAPSSDEPVPAVTETDAPTRPRRILRGIVITLLSLLGAVLLAFGTLTGILFYESRAQTVDLDARPTLGLIEENAFFAALSAYSVTPDDIDTGKIGDHAIDLVFWGFLNRTAKIAVRDLTPPVLSVYRITQPVGYTPDPALCVFSCTDKTDVTFAFDPPPDTQTVGEQTVQLLATDSGGNTTAAAVRIKVYAETDDDTTPIPAEFGVREEGILTLLSEARPTLTDFDLSDMDLSVTGEYYIKGRNRGDETSRHITHVSLSDTKPPVGRTHSFTYAAANMNEDRALQPEQFVTEISDASPVTLTYKQAPDYQKYETQEIVVTATDAAGNATDFFCQLQLLDIPGTTTVECGTPADAFYSTLLKNVTAEDKPEKVNAFDSETALPGMHTVSLRGKFSTLTVQVEARDTIPPILTLQPLTGYVGSLPDPAAFAKEVTDATPVTLSYLTAPDVSREGTVSVTVVATDAGGNKTKAETTMTVVLDTKPPVFSGIRNIYAQENSTISYRKGVTAYDNADGAVAVKVDASAVNVAKSGTYVITYTATDKAGNVATQNAYVFITGANQTTINMYADQVLSSIITAGMTDRQKASAIYTWCVGHLRYSTSTSHLMGKFLQAAYSGFVTHAGNCYTYYAVASALLTRAGIENMEIQRIKPNNPHYWNLVKIDGSWYHLDTCPKMKKYPIKTFLLTDRQVAEYSRNQAENYYSFDASLYPATP